MPTTTIEERLTAVEKKLDRLLEESSQETKPLPWWESISGTFADNPDYEDAMKRGRAYRESLRPTDTARHQESPLS